MISPSHDKDGFFKYYTAESAKATLRNTERKWSTPLLFNDPFDNQFDLRFEEPTEELAKANLDHFLRVLTSKEPFKPNQFGPQTPSMELLRQIHAANPDLEYSSEDWAYLLEGEFEGMQRVAAIAPETSAEIRRVMADTSILCLSETHNNLLMWSHYAQNHTGAVVKFLALPEVNSPLIVAQPVRYSVHMPRLRFASLLDFYEARVNVLETITLCKSKVWSYEKEWRIVATLRDKAQRYEILPYAPEEVGAVYLGCKMAAEDRNELIDITRRYCPKATIFQAEKHTSEFALRFEEIPQH
jgi:hypothetical protein